MKAITAPKGRGKLNRQVHVHPAHPRRPRTAGVLISISSARGEGGRCEVPQGAMRGKGRRKGAWPRNLGPKAARDARILTSKKFYS
eukprot:scaffold171561_cov30-Tisochrysis_lutea.AAC.1